MIKPIFYLISVIALTSFGCDQGSSAKYFEGEVHYDVKYESLDSNVSNESLAKEMGDQQIWVIKEDKYHVNSNSKGWLGAGKTFFFLEKGVAYFDYEKSDSLFQVNTDKGITELLKVQRIKEDRKTILGDECESVYMEMKDAEAEVSTTFYFNPRYKLNPDKYVHQKLDCFDKVIGETKSIIVRIEIVRFPLYKATFEATDIIEKKVSEEEFQISQTKVMKVIK